MRKRRERGNEKRGERGAKSEGREMKREVGEGKISEIEEKGKIGRRTGGKKS